MAAESLGEALLTPPAGVQRASVCALSGMPANAFCPVRRTEWLPIVDAPPCSWHHLLDGALLTVWPSEYRAWAHQQSQAAGQTVTWRAVPARTSERPAPSARGQQSNVSERSTSPARTRGKNTSASREYSLTSDRRRPAASGLHILNPPDGATYLIDPTLRRDYQTLPLRAQSWHGATIHWTIDGRAVGQTESLGKVMWPLDRGSHRIVARDDEGRRVAVTIHVK
jgi:membrane carboxypeptidase/penicillin-binding protein PbpC